MIMRITFILPTANMSGGVRVVSIYAKALVAMGHDVVLVSPPQRPYSFRSKLKSFLQGKGWPANTPQASHLDGLRLTHHVLDKYRAVIDSDVPDADVVIATWWETAEWVMGLSDTKGAKVYFIQHHEIHPYLPIKRCIATYNLPMHKIVIAQWLARVMKKKYGDSCVDLVPNSVDHSQFYASVRNKQERPTVGFLYSHSSYKGIDITLQAIDKLRKSHPDIRVITFGAVMPVNNNELDQSVEFYHSPKQEEIRELYAKCDIWITASKTEGFNLPAMEAMACRTPVVSTRAGWPEEAIINNVNGFLVEVDDIDALADAVDMILSISNDEWMAMSEQAYKTVEHSSWDDSAAQFEKALVNACARSGRGEISGYCVDLSKSMPENMPTNLG